MRAPTILVVDDEALIRWSLTERLKGEGDRVFEADTGRRALDQLSEGVDLVLLDRIRIDRLTGRRAARHA